MSASTARAKASSHTIRPFSVLRSSERGSKLCEPIRVTRRSMTMLLACMPRRMPGRDSGTGSRRLTLALPALAGVPSAATGSSPGNGRYS